MEVKMMVKFNPLRIGRKKTGKVSIKDGEFKMVVKERARLIGIVTTAFFVVGIILAIVASQFVALIAFIWLVTTFLLGGLLDIANYMGSWVKNRVFWVGKWVIKQPILDLRYGRKKRKELEDNKVYAE